MTQERDLAAAVAEQRDNGDKHFVYLRPDRQHLPGLKVALDAEAERSGRLLVGGEPNGAMVQRMRDFQDLPAVNRDDGRAVLKNLDKIASGQMRVK